ncbi:MAG: hypothetical protein DWQ44_03945 [Bacteroidetes bacterium]|nr:MAG: hypothetical protein DWQ33_03380 [Bacteroidota bacterium]REK00344.1 MAG: hypothetical protein DWQ39_11840 [Bacteroidota bacterium]REK35463.1 MAG: hypothetical protein DWQ44_03945 [Bacteroidota bacterium]REK46853.1 MAG: hypothetical protein DWQ48_13945 [Bacteroidota bacterium]
MSAIKNSIITLSLVFLIGSNYDCFSQQVKWSAPLSDDNKHPYLKILGEAPGGFYMVRSNLSFGSTRVRSGFKTRKYILQKFSSAMSLQTEKELLAPAEAGVIADLEVIDEKVLVVFYTFDKQDRTYSFFAQYLDAALNYSGPAALIDKFASENIDDDNLPGVFYSRNRKMLAFTYRQIAKDKKSQSFTAVLLDSDLNNIYKKEIRFQIPARLYAPLTYVLSNEGNFYVLGIRFLTDKKVKAPGESFYTLHGYNRISGLYCDKEIKIEDKFLTDASVAADAYNKKIVVSGYYSDKTTYSTAGIFYYSMDEDSFSDSKVFTSAFPTSYLQKFIGERKENKSRELINYSIDRLILRNDGGVGLAAESFYQTTRTYWDYYTQTMISHYYYNFGSIMVISVHPDGKLHWTNLVSKEQSSVDDGGFYSSYASVNSGGILYFIYNKYVSERSSVLITSIDGQGNQKTDVLFNEVERVSVLATAAKQIDEETLIMPAYRENKFYLITVSFD